MKEERNGRIEKVSYLWNGKQKYQKEKKKKRCRSREWFITLSLRNFHQQLQFPLHSPLLNCLELNDARLSVSIG